MPRNSRAWLRGGRGEDVTDLRRNFRTDKRGAFSLTVRVREDIVAGYIPERSWMVGVTATKRLKPRVPDWVDSKEGPPPAPKKAKKGNARACQEGRQGQGQEGQSQEEEMISPQGGRLGPGKTRSARPRATWEVHCGFEESATGCRNVPLAVVVSLGVVAPDRPKTPNRGERAYGYIEALGRVEPRWHLHAFCANGTTGEARGGHGFKAGSTARATGRSGRSSRTGRGKKHSSQGVVAVRKGGAEEGRSVPALVILGAHYDARVEGGERRR